MKIEVTWKGVAIFFMVTTVVFGFFFIQTFSKNSPLPKTSFLEEYLTQENEILNREQDSLQRQILSQQKTIFQKDSLLVILSYKKNKIKIVYYEKYQKIDSYFIRQLTTEFDSIFSKNNIN